MNALKIIQIICKVLKILSRVVFVFCLIGFIGCAIGITGLCVIPTGIVINGTAIHNIIEASAEMSIGTCYAKMISGLILCAGECVVAKFSEHYFKNELAAGTPFTYDGAKQLFILAMVTIGVPVVALGAANISYAIINRVFDSVADMHLDSYGSISMTGAFMAFVSLLCRYGADVSTGKATPVCPAPAEKE